MKFQVGLVANGLLGYREHVGVSIPVEIHTLLTPYTPILWNTKLILGVNFLVLVDTTGPVKSVESR